MACEAIPVRLSSHALPGASIHAAFRHVLFRKPVGWIKRSGSTLRPMVDPLRLIHPTLASYLTNSGDSQRGNARKISGATMIKINTASMGINMIMTSLMTSTNLTFAIAHEINKHKP